MLLLCYRRKHRRSIIDSAYRLIAALQIAIEKAAEYCLTTPHPNRLAVFLLAGFVAVVAAVTAVVARGRELRVDGIPVGLGQFVVMPGGKTYYILKRLVNSLFGGVFQGVAGICTNTTE